MKCFRWTTFWGISLAALLCCTVARADTFSFTYSATGSPAFSGSGSFTATPTGVTDQYLISGISGTANGAAITSLLTAFSFPPIGDLANDNDLYFPLVENGALDAFGLSFAAGGTDYNIYYLSGVPSGTYDLISSAFPPTDGNPNDYPTFTLDSFTIIDTTTGTPVTPTDTPEPGSLALLATGLLGIGGAVRRRFAI